MPLSLKRRRLISEHEEAASNLPDKRNQTQALI